MDSGTTLRASARWGFRSHVSLRRISLVLGAVALAGLSAVGAYREFRWKRFAEVTPGAVYRSGELSGRQLERAIDKLKLKTVVCLAPRLAEAERALCKERGVDFVSFAMHSSGDGRADDYAAAVRTMMDPSCQPVLVHCEAGVARTGAAVALYRLARDGWSFDAAIDELKSFERRGRCSPELASLVRRVYLDQRLQQVQTESPSRSR